MWHTVAQIAKIRNIPEADLVDFSLSRDSKYSIIVERGDALIRSWFVDDLIKDFKAMTAEEVQTELEYMINNYPHLAHVATFDCVEDTVMQQTED